MDLDDVTATATRAEPREGLRTALALRRLAERLEALHVSNARAQGLSWADIAAELQVTRQTVHKKHGRAEQPRRGGGHDAR
ncbi:helix-turn-helix domain-containing protein [Pseudokineococcus sp. 1T1Z-3]|uniref:helix-turn-helix domain-containing protein n=1 Tax=Pseudokineococcus sp. 1T1Z-3 TaxID=3132745 RepID=UPI0030A6DEBE